MYVCFLYNLTILKQILIRNWRTSDLDQANHQPTSGRDSGSRIDICNLSIYTNSIEFTENNITKAWQW